MMRNARLGFFYQYCLIDKSCHTERACEQQNQSRIPQEIRHYLFGFFSLSVTGLQRLL